MLAKNHIPRAILVLALLLAAAPAARAGQDAVVRGELEWTPETQTLRSCGSHRVYWVRVLASNPFFHLTKRVDELAVKNGETVIAELRGEVETGVPSAGPRYPVDATLNVHQILSIEKGNCEK